MKERATEQSVPSMAVWLGAAGVVPFAAGSLASWILSPKLAQHAIYLLVAYGAIILSFMGAIYWGLVMTSATSRKTNPAYWYVISVIPALVGWVALMLIPLHALILLVFAFAAIFALDLTAIFSGLAPAWYGRLRAPLTGIVILLLLTAIGAAAFRLS